MTRHSPADRGLLLLRVAFGSLLLWLHGVPRLVHIFDYFVRGQDWRFVEMVGRIGLPYPLLFALLSSVAESLAALLIVLGMLSRWAAVMIVELPALYLLGALVLAVAGPGACSVDGLLSARSGRKDGARGHVPVATVGDESRP
jgi:uncharacterized membrane protein YphA (DoxX/SURF4 family)